MLIKIDEDLFDICKRIKEIDDGYFVVYNTNKLRYELHYKNQENTYCLTCPYENLDVRFVDLVLFSSINNIDKIIDDIDNNNVDIECNYNKSYKDYAKYHLKEIYKFASNSSKNFSNKTAFKSNWR
ncbi:MAG: hypothetical protein E7345_00885 [Clostridiales bacterium]|nr:hypothetical protein [Clostridiales bacterium]